MDFHKSDILHYCAIVCCIVIVFLTGCITSDQGVPSSHPTDTSKDQSLNKSSGTSWLTMPITDAVTGKETTIADLASSGKPVIMHTFAVWCPACSMQLRETKKLNQNNPNQFIILGVDIDPRENTAQVKSHIEKNKFDGMYVTASQEFTRSLIGTVGSQVVQSLPQTVIIKNQSVTYIGDGVFPENNLKVILSELPS